MIPCNEWQAHGIPKEHIEGWTIEKLKSHQLKTLASECKTSNDIHEVEDYPLWEFVEVFNLILPILHAEIGLGNKIFDSFLNVVDDRVEALVDEEQSLRQDLVVADVLLEKMMTQLNDFKKMME